MFTGWDEGWVGHGWPITGGVERPPATPMMAGLWSRNHHPEELDRPLRHQHQPEGPLQGWHHPNEHPRPQSATIQIFPLEGCTFPEGRASLEP
jgi:hypothetical protein